MQNDRKDIPRDLALVRVDNGWTLRERLSPTLESRLRALIKKIELAQAKLGTFKRSQ